MHRRRRACMSRKLQNCGKRSKTCEGKTKETFVFLLGGSWASSVCPPIPIPSQSPLQYPHTNNPLVGVSLGFIFIKPTDIQDLHASLTLLLSEYDINFPELPDPDFSRVDAEWQRLRRNIPEFWKLHKDGREFQVGEEMKVRGLSAEYPVVLIPGIISTGLESWLTAPEYRAFFRKKLWGSFNMISQVTLNRGKWRAAMMLNPVTGLDPPGAKIPAAEGIDKDGAPSSPTYRKNVGRSSSRCSSLSTRRGTCPNS
ncbi:hypothetical protein PLICRDRAFT_656916 [Plicaturopsis crispa FD-325 SS-3]|nr:hypothetical protein PLICRDRAFT_656916 [Plicaturopsis crispa FD-325 SS-3]